MKKFINKIEKYIKLILKEIKRTIILLFISFFILIFIAAIGYTLDYFYLKYFVFNNYNYNFFYFEQKNYIHFFYSFINFKKLIFENFFNSYLINYDYFDLDFFFQNNRKRKRHKLSQRHMQYFDRYFVYLKQKVIFGWYNNQFLYNYYLKSNVIPNTEVPLKNISILTTDTVTFVIFYLKLIYNNIIKSIYYFFNEFILYLNKIPNINKFVEYISTVFLFIYFYFYIFFKFIFLFFYKCIDILFVSFNDYLFNFKNKIPLIGIWCQFYESKEYPKAFLQLRFIFGNFGFDVFGPPYNSQKHYFNFLGKDFELKFKNISLFLFDWINLRDFILLVQLIHNLKKIYWVFIYDFAGNINFCILKGINESINLETKQLNIFKLFINENFTYGFFGFIIFFSYHAIFLEFFFFILDQIYLFLTYWYWRYLKIFGNSLQKSKASLIIRGFDLVDYQKEAEIVLKDLNSTMFGLFLSFEAIMKERMILDPEEMLIAARFLDIEYRYRLIEFFMEFFHRLEEEIDKNRPLTFMEEILNHEDIKTTEESYLKYFYKSENYDNFVKESISFKIENKIKKQRNDRKNIDLLFFKNNPNIIFEKKHFEVLADIYKEQIMLEYAYLKYNKKK